MFSLWSAELCDAVTNNVAASPWAIGLAELIPPVLAASNKSNAATTIDDTQDGLLAPRQTLPDMEGAHSIGQARDGVAEVMAAPATPAIFTACRVFAESSFINFADANAVENVP